MSGWRQVRAVQAFRDACEQPWPVGEELLDRLVPLGEVAVSAAGDEVIDAVGAGGAWSHVVEFEAYFGALATDATAAVSFEDVGSDLPSEEGAALVLDAVDIRVHHQLLVKLVALNANPRDGVHPA